MEMGGTLAAVDEGVHRRTRGACATPHNAGIFGLRFGFIAPAA